MRRNQPTGKMILRVPSKKDVLVISEMTKVADFKCSCRDDLSMMQEGLSILSSLFEFGGLEVVVNSYNDSTHHIHIKPH